MIVDLINLSRSKDSHLCIGLDPSVEIESRISHSLEIIDETHDLVVAYKPNRQFWLGSTLDELRQVNRRIHKYGCLSICDHKLTDIGSSNLAAIKTISNEEFDYLTVSPFPGNIKQTCNIAREHQLGSIALVLMSNPESTWMIEKGMHVEWTKQANKFSDGVVIGTTSHILSSILAEIADHLDNKFVLAPGIGTQQGKIAPLLEIFGDAVIFNISRSISQADNYRDAATQYSAWITQRLEESP